MTLVFNKIWWGQLSVLFFWVITFILFLQFDPIFNPQNDLLLLLLPLAWGSVVGVLQIFKPDPVVITPKNIMLFIWFNKLIIIPLEILWLGNRIHVETYPGQEISTEIITNLVSFIAFVVGWNLPNPTQSTRVHKPFIPAKTWIMVYYIIAFVSIILLYGSLRNYWSKAIYTYTTLEIVEQNATFMGFLANIGQRFWPFGVFLAWFEWRKNKSKVHWAWAFAWLLLCFAGTLSSNRSNMIYPSLTFGSILYTHWRPNKTVIIVILQAGMLFLLFYGYVRVQPALDSEQIGLLFDEYLSNTDYVWYAHQLYLGSPYQITPLLTIPNSSSTLLASVLEPVPMLGKSFREQSGPYIYNLAYHDSLVSQDKVIPVAGELYYNGGYILVAVGYILFGIVYRRLDVTFKKNAEINPPLAAAFFYLALLFSATLLLSLSVLMQFMVYNAAPALLIIAANWSRIRKAS